MAVMFKCNKVPDSKPYDKGTMTVRLDTNNDDPNTWATYFDDAAGLSVGSSNFDTFFGHYPCVLADGVELGKLSRSNFNYYDGGGSAPITTIGNDVMICFPRRGLKIWYEGNYLYVSITTEPNKSGYEYYAFTYKGNACDKTYISAYSVNLSDGYAYSTSGQTTSVDTITNMRVHCQDRGDYYNTFGYYQLVYLQAMYLIKYKGLISGLVFGYGYGYSDPTHGSINTKGMDVTQGNSGVNHPKLFGIEALWSGKYPLLIDGIYSNSSGYPTVSDGNYNDTGSGYTRCGNKTPILPTETISTSALCHVQGTTQAGFFPYKAQDSIVRNTFFGSGWYLSKNRMMELGNLPRETDGGIFNMNTTRQASSYNRAMLCYFHKK